MSLKAMYLTILLLLNFTVQLNLIPDKINPLMVESPSKNKISTFSIKFSFPANRENELGMERRGSNGIENNQFFGLQFPANMGGDLNFDNSVSWTCYLSDGFYTYDIEAVTPERSYLTNALAEKNIAYCKLKDFSENVPLRTGPEIIYTLKIKFNNSFNNSFIRGLSFFTSTSNKPEKIIIDSLPVLGSVAIYNDWTTLTNPPLELVSSEVLNVVGYDDGSGGIYPGTVFDFNLVLKANNFISKADHVIIIKYPSDTVKAARNVISVGDLTANSLIQKLGGKLSLKAYGEDKLVLEGWDEDIIPNKRFRITLKAFTALNTNLDRSTDIEVYVYYKNSYTVLSYFSQTFVTVDKDRLSLKASHPEFWDLYRNGAWPIKFTITPRIKLENSSGIFVVIQHTEAKESTSNGGNILTFLASTCDFSENTSFNNDFGSRPSCYPLRIDHNYSTKSTGFDGSGVFFHVKDYLAAEIEFYITVWVFTDVCAGDNYNNGSGQAFSIPNFEVFVFKDLKANLFAEKRFHSEDIIAYGTVDFSGKCWNNKIQAFSFSQSSNENINTGDNSFKPSEFIDTITGNTRSFTTRFKEIYSWKIAEQTHTTCDDINKICHGNDISGSIEEKFLYSESNKISSESYFLAEADLTIGQGGYLKDALPGQYASSGPQKGTITAQFSKKWFIGTENYKSNKADACYFSWALANPGSSTNKNSKILNIDITNHISSPTKKNFIGARRGLNMISEFNESATDLNTSITTTNNVNNIMKLVSQTNSADNNSKWLYFDDEIPDQQTTKVAWFTNCLKWNTSVAIKSLYTYIDIQFIWRDDRTNIFSNTRLIKLFPEKGVFNDKEKFAGSVTTNPYINHVVITSKTDMGKIVCLVEIDGSAINNVVIGDSESNVFALWLGFGVLLESDYSDASATYPAGPLSDNANSYGLQSQTQMHPENLYVNVSKYTNENIPLYVLLLQLQNPSTWGNSSATIPKGEQTSSYHFLMGSLLLITGLTNQKIQSKGAPLFIPYYCPYNYNPNKVSRAQYLNFGPSIFGAWLNMKDHANIPSLNRYLDYGEIGKKMSIILSKTDVTKSIKTGPFKGYSVGDVSTISENISTLGLLRWKAYTDFEDDLLEVFNGVYGQASDNHLTCTGFSLFLNMNALTLDNDIIFSALQKGRLGFYDSSKIFYVYGLPFKKVAFWGGFTTTDTVGTVDNIQISDPSIADSASSLKIYGIKRPNIEYFINDKGKFEISKSIGFSCVPADVTKYNGLVNYYKSNDISQVVIDIKPSNSDWKVDIYFDENDISANDVAAHAVFDITTPSDIPAGSSIFFYSDQFKDQTICGIYKGKFAEDCLKSISTQFECKAPGTTDSFKICCYNIEINTEINLTMLKLNFNKDPAYNATNLLSVFNYDAAPQIAANQFKKEIPDNLKDIMSDEYAYIYYVTYSQINQVSGIGKITFFINLPRQPVRNMNLSIEGDLSMLLINNINPRCLASFSQNGIFGSDWENGDALIDNCFFEESNKPIQISTKNIAYQCGASFSKKINISLWPVLVIDWRDQAITNKYKVNLNLITGNQNVSLNDQEKSLNYSGDLLGSPPVVQQWENLCTVSSVTPRIPGEISDYVFDIDLTTNKDLLLTSDLNEVTIFWPYNLYGSFIENILCYYNNSLVNCMFTDEGILNIKFIDKLQIGLPKPISIKIYGIVNPEVNGDVIFACTVNNINISTGERKNIIIGSGKLAEGITYNSILIPKSGNLRFLFISDPVSDKNPRRDSQHSFRVTFDSAIGLTPLPITIDSTPILYIYFPAEYNLTWNSSIPSVTINQYTSNLNNQTVLSTTYTSNTVLITGNRVTITFKTSSLTLPQNFRYWDIRLSNILNPEISINSEDYNKHTTGFFQITLTNSVNTVLFNTLTNVNTYASEIIDKMQFDLLNWNKGNIYEYSTQKWIVDFHDSYNEINRVHINPGRYRKIICSFRENLHPDSKNAIGSISLKDSIFKTSNSVYKIDTNDVNPYELYLGVPCGTAEGYYILNFSLSGSSHFEPLSRVIAVLDNSSKGIISFIAPSNVPIGGSAKISIYLNEYNFSALNINWELEDNSQNDQTAKMQNIKINSALDFSYDLSKGPDVFGYSEFSITSTKEVNTPQVFIPKVSDSCWTFEDIQGISITISGTIPDLADNLDLSQSFIFFDANIDTTLEKNSIKFVFTPPIDTMYLFCALVCIDKDFPTEEQIYLPNKKDDSFVQFYKGFFFNKNPVDIFFKNLIRGQDYKMKCIAQSSHAEFNLRSTKDTIILNPIVEGSNSNSKLSIKPVKPVDTKCIKFNFMNTPSKETTSAMIKYCQSLFYEGGWNHNGCVICTDYDAKEFAMGFQLPSNINCLNTTTAPTRFLQPNTIVENSVSNSTSYSICALAHPICKTDVNLYKKSYDDVIDTFTDTLITPVGFKMNLNIQDFNLNTTILPTFDIDLVEPDIRKVTASLIKYELNGLVSFKAKSDKLLKCYWMISSDYDTTPPSFYTLENCNSQWCGVAKLGLEEKTFTTDSKNLKALTEDFMYSIFLGCVNDIPLSRKRSEILSIANLQIPKKKTDVTIASNSIKEQIIPLLIIIILIFN